MNRFIEAFRNLFRIPRFAEQGVVYPGAARGVSHRRAHSHAGHQHCGADKAFEQGQGSVLGIFDLFSGGNLRRLTIFALGIMPYITRVDHLAVA